MSAETKKKRAPAKKPSRATAKKAPRKATKKPSEEAESQAVEKAEETKPAPVEEPEAVKPGGRPEAEVSARHQGSMRERGARGFSLGELESAGVPRSAAKRLDLSVDVRRRSVLNGNVEKLRSWFKPQAPAKAVGKKKKA